MNISPEARIEMDKRLDALSDELDEFKRSVLAQEKIFLNSIYRMGVQAGKTDERFPPQLENPNGYRGQWPEDAA